jgi:hypothetical protein
LLHYLETHRVVVPGYSFLQDVVSQVLADERRRLTTILERTLDLKHPLISYDGKGFGDHTRLL